MAAKSISHAKGRKKRGLSETICLTCVATVGGCIPEELGGQFEQSKVCDSAFLAERGLFARAESRKFLRSSPKSQAA
jgi:hypothetical protein